MERRCAPLSHFVAFSYYFFLWEVWGCLVAKGHIISKTNVLYSYSLSLSLQVEVKKAEPRYATASATGNYPASMAAYGGTNAAGTNYGGKNEYVSLCQGVYLMAYIVFLLVLLCYNPVMSA